MLGLLGSAMAGGAQAVQDVSKGRIEEKRRAALEKLRATNEAKAPTSAAKQQKELIAGGMEPGQAQKVAYGIKAEKNEPLVVNNQIVDPETKEVLGDYRDPESASGRGGQAPADVRTAEWMLETGQAKTYDEAWNRAKMATYDPVKYVGDYVSQQMKAQQDSYLTPEDEGYRTPEQLREEAIEQVQWIRSQSYSPISKSQGAPKSTGLIDSSMKVLPEDGSAVPQADGSYTGKVNRSPESQAPQPQSQGKTPVVRSDEDYERLPPGAVFVDEEGNRYQKPAE